MSMTRETHPGYYGVLMGLALPWYCGLGATFVAQGDELAQQPSYQVATHFIDSKVWGVLYLLTGLSLLIAANVRRIPHRWVRRVLCGGWLMTLFFLLTFIVYDFEYGIPPATLIPAFLTIVLIEYRAIVEPEVNPASGRRTKQRGRRRWSIR